MTEKIEKGENKVERFLDAGFFENPLDNLWLIHLCDEDRLGELIADFERGLKEGKDPSEISLRVLYYAATLSLNNRNKKANEFVLTALQNKTLMVPVMSGIEAIRTKEREDRELEKDKKPKKQIGSQ